MAFFMPYAVRHNAHSEAPLADLLRLVDDLNTFPSSSNSRRGGGCQRRYAYRHPAAAAPSAAPRRPWNPRFEARETEDAYILRGELPGLNRDHVTLEFLEAQKLVVTGKVTEEPEEETTPPAAPAAPVDQTATTEEDEHMDDSASETASRSSYQATVEDAADEDDDFEVVQSHAELSPKQQEKQPEVQHLEKAVEEPAPQQPQKPEPRILRQFSKTFTFASPIEYDFVTASLKDGLLEVVIPKEKHTPHQVVVN